MSNTKNGKGQPRPDVVLPLNFLNKSLVYRFVESFVYVTLIWSDGVLHNSRLSMAGGNERLDLRRCYERIMIFSVGNEQILIIVFLKLIGLYLYFGLEIGTDY